MMHEKNIQTIAEDAVGGVSPPNIKVNLTHLAHVTGYNYDYLKCGKITKTALPKILKAKDILERNISNALEQAKREYEDFQQQEGGELCV